MTSLSPAWPWVWALHRRRTPRQWGGCPGCTDHMTSPAPGGPHQPPDHCCCCDDPDDGDLHWDHDVRCSPAEGGPWCGQCLAPGTQLSSARLHQMSVTPDQQWKHWRNLGKYFAQNWNSQTLTSQSTPCLLNWYRPLLITKLSQTVIITFRRKTTQWKLPKEIICTWSCLIFFCCTRLSLRARTNTSFLGSVVSEVWDHWVLKDWAFQSYTFWYIYYFFKCFSP